MCGIAGFWKHEKLEPEAEHLLHRMTETLHHRGPDGYGYHVDREKGIAMGHARLSIIDLETGNQPLYSFDHQHALTTNGEFYDYKRIRTHLRLEGFKFKTKSDSEIALPLYQKHGLDFVNHLRGEFAISLFDGRLEKLILIRDRFGIKPLFYHINNEGVFYGSEIKALFAHLSIPKRFSPESALHQLMHTMVPGTTAFDGIHALKPGFMLIITKTKTGFDVKEKCYWDVNFPKKDERDPSLSADFHINNVRDKLMEAVELRLEADVPVGCYLSGGIDSCSMLGLASSMQQSPVKAFTISFDHDAYDEAAIAREMAAKTGADHELIRLTADDLYGDNYVKTIWHAERTFYNTLGVAKWCMSKRVNECGYKTVVTGEGADELFSGYPAFKRDMFLHGHESGSPEERESHRQLIEKTNQLFKGAILSDKPESHPEWERSCGFTPSWIQPWMQTLAIARPLLHDDMQAQLKDYDPLAAIAASFNTEQMAGRHFLDIAQYTWIKTMLECQILNWGGDRVDMANSMESRPAFLDHHVAEIAVAIPPHLRIKGNIEKWPLREAMREIITEALYKREKFAFMAPPGHTDEKKRIALQSLIGEFLNEDAVKDAQLFDLKRLKKFLNEYSLDKDPVSLTRKDALLNHLIGMQALHHFFIRQNTLAAV